jgi:hypothetical protein
MLPFVKSTNAHKKRQKGILIFEVLKVLQGFINGPITCATSQLMIKYRKHFLIFMYDHSAAEVTECVLTYDFFL